jgi:CDP-paratose 2-epimerase
LVKCNLDGTEYRIFGYLGKQVRDNIHSHDVARFAEAFFNAPTGGEVYNIGGGKANSCSILEAFRLVQEISGKPMKTIYIDEHRTGDHICYYSDLSKIRRHYPDWNISLSLRDTISQMVSAWEKRLAT